MIDPQNYLEINRQLWNSKTPHHLASEFYDVEGFMKGRNTLNAPEIGLLGDVSGKHILHLQCHFGQDTISLSRMGASVTGVDFSEKAIEAAKDLAIQTNSQAKFICCDIYSLPQHADSKFDSVFTSYGTIGWLPDIKKWAGVVSHFLKPGGKFVFVEFHPVVWMMDGAFKEIAYSYFNREAIVEEEEGTYADRSAPVKNVSVGWNHSLAEVAGALLDAGLQLTSFDEYDYSPYNCFNNMVEEEPGKFRVAHLAGKLPLLYSLTARKPAA